MKQKYYLKHYGIPDMSWGKRNGPPYPLSKSVHNAVVSGHNPAGSKKTSNYGSSSVVSTKKIKNPSQRQQERFNSNVEKTKSFFKQYAKQKISDAIKHPSKEQKIARGVGAAVAAKSVSDSVKNLMATNAFLSEFGRKVAPSVAVGKTIGAAALAGTIAGTATYGIAKGIKKVKEKLSGKKTSDYGRAVNVGDVKITTEAGSNLTKGIAKMFPKTSRNDLSAYSDSDLQKMVNRQQLEMRYDQLNPNVVEKTATKVDNIIKTAGAGATVYLAYKAIKRG